MTEIKAALNPKALRVNKQQFAPDCSQNSYLTLLDNQDPIIGDYTKVIRKNSAGQAVPIVSKEHREKIVGLLQVLNQKKKYRVETFHAAVGIMDRFHNKIINSGAT